MTISDFVKKYYLHDSGLNSITIDRNGKTVRLSVDLCNWMQDNYIEEEPEIKPIEIVFFGVTKMENLDRVIDKDFGDEFLAGDIDEDGAFHAEIVTSKEEEFYEIKILAKDVRIFNR